MVPEDDSSMVRTPHLDLAYERELDAVSTHVARMAQLADNMVRDAVHSVLTHDAELAKKVEEEDAVLDAYELECDELCVRLMARRAPVGADLRMITATLKIVTDLERIGDLAVNIAKRGQEINGGIGGVPAEVSDLAHTAVEELAHAMKALATRDAALARNLRAEDQGTDARNRAAFDRLMAIAQAHQDAFSEVLALTSVCRHLERIGDHAVNVAEMIVYMVEGKVLRHRPD
jgi:phosphate transport system protein